MLAFTMACSSEQIVIDGVDMVGMQTSHWYWEPRIALELVNITFYYIGKPVCHYSIVDLPLFQRETNENHQNTRLNQFLF